jgi:hypothetical protein
MRVVLVKGCCGEDIYENLIFDRMSITNLSLSAEVIVYASYAITRAQPGKPRTPPLPSTDLSMVL